MGIVNRELTELVRRRKAQGKDIREFSELVKEAEELFLSDADLSDNAELFTPVANRVRGGMTVGDLRKLIFEVCNILEESPLKLYITKLRLERKEPIDEWELEALENMNWRLDTVKQKERRSIVERLVKLQDKIEK